MIRISRTLALLALLVLTSAARVSADVVVSPMFGDHMVLQRGIKIPVWGKAEPGERVTVTLADQSQSATADADGRWRVTLARIAGAVAEPALTMKVAAKSGGRTFSDVLVGDVWVCSGQSNMEFATKAANNAEQEIAEAEKWPQ